MPKVLNKKFDYIPILAVNGSRSGPFGNFKFKIGTKHKGIVLDRQGAVDAHKDWFLHSREGLELLSRMMKLRGRDFWCWCAPEPCHCDIYVEVLNS